MNHTITTTLDNKIYIFLKEQAKLKKKSESIIIEEALNLYKKYESENSKIFEYSEIKDQEWVNTFNKISGTNEKTIILG